jgi:ankyrin repeat protein
LNTDANLKESPKYGDNKECKEIELLCRMTPDEAARQVGTTLLLRVVPHTSWESIRESIRSNGKGVVGSSLILALACTGLELPTQLLLEKGADIETKNPNEGTPLILAAREKKKAVMQVLLGKGANINAASKFGNTPLIFAAKSGDESLVRMLLEKGAKVNRKNQEGKTAIDFAVSYPASKDLLTAAAARKRMSNSQ